MPLIPTKFTSTESVRTRGSAQGTKLNEKPGLPFTQPTFTT